MGNEEQYELWRRQRSKVDIPDDFANRVMMSIHQARRRVWWSVLHKLAMVAGRSRIVRTGLYCTGVCRLDHAGCKRMHDIHSIGIVKGNIAMTEVNQRKRRPSTAVVLSMLCTGLGHIYCGRFSVGLALNLVALLPVPFAVAAAYLPNPRAGLMALILACAFVLAVYLYAIVDSCRLARRIGEHYELKDYNRGIVYFLFIVAGIIHAPAVAMYIRASVLEAFYCPSDSMSPTLQRGDRFLVNKLLQRKLPHRGDVVVFLCPDNRDLRYVKHDHRASGRYGLHARQRGLRQRQQTGASTGSHF